MASSADHALISEPGRRLHFSLRDLMALVFGVSVGLAAARQSWVEWYEGLLVAAVCWFVLGLGSQILDLRAALRRTAGLSTELRWGGRCAIAWRAAAIAILAGYCAIEALQRQGILVLERHESIALFDVGAQLRTILFYIAIVFVLSSVPRLAPQPPARMPFQRFLGAAAWGTAAIVCMLVWSDRQQLAYFVHIAVSGIEATFPLRFANPHVDLDLVARTKRFAIHTTLAAALVPLNLWLTNQLALGWRLGARRLRLPAVCLLVSLGATIAYLIWFRMAGLAQFSPCFAENPSAVTWHLWLTAGLVLMLGSGAASYRLVCSTPAPTCALSLDWRREPTRYYHERRLTMLTLSVSLGGSIAAALLPGSDFGWQSVLAVFFTWPENYSILAAFWLALRGLLGGSRNSSKSAANGQIGISLPQLGAVWLPMFATLASSISLISWLSFSLWLWLGYRFDWP